MLIFKPVLKNKFNSHELLVLTELSPCFGAFDDGLEFLDRQVRNELEVAEAIVVAHVCVDA